MMGKGRKTGTRGRPVRGVQLSKRGGQKKTGKKSQGYTIRDSKGRVTYVGESNDLQRRAAEHKRDGKRGTLRVETRPMPRGFARSWEKRKLARHRKTHGGQNPVHNKTPSGGWKS